MPLLKINVFLSTIKETRKSLLSLVDQGVVSIANFATGVIIGRSCSEEQFGLYMLAFTIMPEALDRGELCKHILFSFESGAKKKEKMCVIEYEHDLYGASFIWI